MSASEFKDNVSADTYKNLMEQAQAKGSFDESITLEEQGRFKKAFEDPEFRKLFAGYMDELQDPANRDVSVYVKSYVSICSTTSICLKLNIRKYVVCVLSIMSSTAGNGEIY